jgi:hypothetical protein
MDPKPPQERTDDARVPHAVTLAFDDFGWESLQAEAGAHGDVLDEWLGTAAVYYDNAVLRTNRPAPRGPRFKPEGRGTPRRVSLKLSSDRWKRLEEAAAEQGIGLERLIEHAALFYLADIHSGRVADHILSRANEGTDHS